MELNAELPMAPSGWRVREALSYDLPRLWPAGLYEVTVARFENAGSTRGARLAFLRRSGVRRCVLPLTEPRQWRAVAKCPAGTCGCSSATRGDAGLRRLDNEVSRDAADLGWQREALFDTALPTRGRGWPPLPAAGTGARPYLPSVARIVQDGGPAVVVEASAGKAARRPRPAGLVRSVLDGRNGRRPSTIVRANGVYRAVALPPAGT